MNLRRRSCQENEVEQVQLKKQSQKQELTLRRFLPVGLRSHELDVQMFPLQAGPEEQYLKNAASGGRR